MKQLIVIVSLIIFGWTAPAWSQDVEALLAEAIANGAPTETTGIEVTLIPGAIPLGSYNTALEGSQLRAREIVLLPGGRIAVHSHDKRAAIAYVLEGELVEHRSDADGPIVRRQGDTFIEGPGLVHWSENASSEPARVIAVDILPAATE